MQSCQPCSGGGYYIVGGALMNTNGLILLQPANNSIFASATLRRRAK